MTIKIIILLSEKEYILNFKDATKYQIIEKIKATLKDLEKMRIWQPSQKKE